MSYMCVHGWFSVDSCKSTHVSIDHAKQDVLTTLSKNRLKEAQSLELKQEIVRSQALKEHFEDNPKDLQVLLHDVNKYERIKQPELKNIPDYLMPTAHDSAQIKKGSLNSFFSHVLCFCGFLLLLKVRCFCFAPLTQHAALGRAATKRKSGSGAAGKRKRKEERKRNDPLTSLQQAAKKFHKKGFH